MELPALVRTRPMYVALNVLAALCIVSLVGSLGMKLFTASFEPIVDTTYLAVGAVLFAATSMALPESGDDAQPVE